MFEVGDIVRRIGPNHLKVVKGGVYTVSEIVRDYGIILKETQDQGIYDAESFELLTCPKAYDRSELFNDAKLFVDNDKDHELLSYSKLYGKSLFNGSKGSNMFEVGDIVRRVYCDYAQAKVGNIYTITDVNHHGIKLKETNDEVTYEIDNFNLVKGDILSKIKSLENEVQKLKDSIAKKEHIPECRDIYRNNVNGHYYLVAHVTLEDVKIIDLTRPDGSWLKCDKKTFIYEYVGKFKDVFTKKRVINSCE